MLCHEKVFPANIGGFNAPALWQKGNAMQKNTVTEVKIKPCWVSELQDELQCCANICIQNLSAGWSLLENWLQT